MESSVNEVAGGFEATDPALKVTVFARTAKEAQEKLERERIRAIRLDAIVAERGM